ncbi:MAG: hypothetical protein DRQ02_07205 [Candidatus Latescibacterota bacterium]|nr:MAG: hypothetical protein DRQ02_07205 [Candidatus Latescibacterota bacterium]
MAQSERLGMKVLLLFVSEFAYFPLQDIRAAAIADTRLLNLNDCSESDIFKITLSILPVKGNQRRLINFLFNFYRHRAENVVYFITIMAIG